MEEYEISDAAVQDLLDIWNYYAVYSQASADRRIDKFIRTFRLLHSMPGIGRVRREYGQQMHSLPLDQYTIYYERVDQGVRIKRVLRGARHVTLEMFNE